MNEIVAQEFVPGHSFLGRELDRHLNSRARKSLTFLYPRLLRRSEVFSELESGCFWRLSRAR